MKKKPLYPMLLFFLLLAGNLLAQPDCTEFPSPVIQPDFIAYCQEEPKDTFDHPGTRSLLTEQEVECFIACSGSEITYTTSFNSGSTYDWQAFGDFTLSTDPSPPNEFTLTWNNPGAGVIMVTETNSMGCSTTVSICVEIVQGPDAKFTSMPEEVGGVITICQGGEVHFQDLSSDDVISWSWDFGDGATSNDPSPTHPYGTPGSYDVILEVTNDCGCTDIATVVVEVLPAQAPIIECISTVCEGDEATYSVTNACDGATFDWSISGGYIDSQMGNTVTVVWDSPINAQGFLSVLVTGCGNDCPVPTTVIIPIRTADLTLSGPSVVCLGDMVEYAIDPQPGVLYTWYNTGASFLVSQPNDHSAVVLWDQIGSYRLCVRLSEQEFRCGTPYGEYCIDVEVKRPFEVSPTNQEICEGETATFFTQLTNPNGSFPADWQAIDDGGTTVASASGTPSFTVGPLPPGFYEIQATDPNDDYCNPTASGFLQVNPTAPAFDQANLTGELIICPESSYNYSATPDDGYYFTWAVNGGTLLGTGNEVAITWNASGPYQILITQNSMTEPNCPTQTTIDVDPVVPVAPTFTGGPDFCVDGTGTITASLSPDVTYVEWEIFPAAIGSVIAGQNTDQIDVKWNNTDMNNVQVRCHYTICNVVYTEVYLVNVLPFPTINLTIPAEACQNDPTSYTAALSFLPGGSTVNWLWEFGGVPVTDSGDPSNVTYSFPSYGTQVITVTATLSGSACPGTVVASQIINVKPAPLVNITATDGNQLCASNNFMTDLVASVQNAPGGSGTYNYSWNTGATTPTITVTAVGTYILTVTDAVTGCSTSESFFVGDNCNPPTPCSGVDFTASQSDCNSFNFFGSLSGGWSNPQWSFGDGGSASGINATHEYDHSGYYIVTLTGQNGGSFCSKSYQIIVHFVPDFIAEFSCPGNVIEMDLIDQTDYLPGTSLTYNWSWTSTGGSGSSSSQNPSGIAIAATSVNVTLVVSDGSTSCTVNQTINIPTPVDADFNALDEVCEGTPVIFNNTSSPAANVIAATWDFGDGSGSNLIPSTQRTYTYPLTGPTVTLFVEDAFGCTDTYSEAITVYENGMLGNVSIIDPTIPACPTPPLNLVSSVSGGAPAYQYQWYSDDMGLNLGTGSSSNPILVTGEYFVQVTDDNDCVARSENEPVIIIPAPVPFILGETDYCLGESAFVNGNQGTGYTYSWTITRPDLSTYTVTGSWASALNISLNQEGTYTVDLNLLDNATNCEADSDPFLIEVHPAPEVEIPDSNPDCAPATITSNLLTSDPVTYVWSTGDNTPDTYAAGGGVVEVTVFNEWGCSGSDAYLIGEGPDLADVAVGCYCFPEPIAWEAPQGYGYSYQWFMVGNPSPIAFTQEYTISTSGVYYVVVTDYTGCSSTSDMIIMDIGDICGKCEFEVRPLELECVGIDEYTGGTIYSFTSTVTNFGMSLNGLSGSSAEGIVGPITPSAIPGNGAMTAISGTFILLPGFTSAVIEFEAAGADGIHCSYKLEVPNFPDCTGEPCNIEWKEPQVKCIYKYKDWNYYTFTVDVTNYGNTLEDLVMYPCHSPYVIITSSNSTLPGGGVTTTITGLVQGHMDIPNDCINICGYDPIAKKICCQKIFMDFPDCKIQTPCSKVTITGKQLYCIAPNIDQQGNLEYYFNIAGNSTFINADAVYLVPETGQAENHVTNVNFFTSGINFQIGGKIVDVPLFDDPLCFRVIVEKGGKVCWAKLCMKVPECFEGEGENRLVQEELKEEDFEEGLLAVAPNSGFYYANGGLPN